MELGRQLGVQSPSLGSEKSSQSRSPILSSTVEVAVKFTNSSDSLTVRNNQFQIQYTDNGVRSQLAGAFSYLLKSLDQKSNSGQASPPLQKQLIALDKPLALPLPDSINKLLKINGVSHEQLLKLTTKSGGYALGEGKLTGKQLILNQDTAINLKSSALRETHYRVSIIQYKGQLKLSLSPILAKTNVTLTPIGIVSSQGAGSTSGQANSGIQTRIETSTLYRETIKHLNQSQTEKPWVYSPEVAALNKKGVEIAKSLSQSVVNSDTRKLAQVFNTNGKGTPLFDKGQNAPDPTKPESRIGSPSAIDNRAKQLQEISSTLTTKLATSPKEVPDSALRTEKLSNRDSQVTSSKSMPSDNSKTLLNLLSTKLPGFFPNALEELAKPDTLKNELISSSGISLSQNLASSTLVNPTNTNALSTLFQLLLGLRANATGAQISKQLLQQLQKLQQTHQIDSNLLNRLNKAGMLETSAQIASSFQLYQQASTQEHQGTNWYFALPYQVNDRQEQFEGHFENGNSDDDSQSQEWRLQLKFHLNQGSMLVMAHKRSEKLSLTFKTESDELLNRINQHISPLDKKLSALGFNLEEIKTQFQVIPATLLPGDYYLVHTSA